MQSSGAWFSDDASPGAADSLGRAPFLRRVWDIIQQSHEERSSTVFGLVGPWGTGKSSMVEWLVAEAASEAGHPVWTTVTFNPWDYQDAASLQVGFFSELTAAFGGPARLDEVRSRVAAFGRSVAPFASIGSLVGLDLSKTLEAASDLVDGDRSVAAARRKLERSLDETRTPVLVVIDDLDRVSAEELLLTLKLVRQLGRLPYVHYLLSYDEQTILDVLTRTSLIGQRTPGRARDYMEKVVQVRFDIPSLRPVDTLRLMNRGLDDLRGDGWLELCEADALRFSAAYFSFIAARLDTPRAIKRYFAQLRLLDPSMISELDFVDFLILTWLRTAEPAVYYMIQQRRADLTGGASTSTFARDSREDLERQGGAWRAALVTAGTREEHLEGVARAVGAMFPRFAAAWGQAAGSVERSSAPRIADATYFDRYFSFGVPGDDIADSTIHSAFQAYSNGLYPNDPSALRVSIAVFESPELVIGKIVRELDEQKPAAPALFNWLGSVHKSVPPRQDFISPTRQLEGAVALRMRGMTKEQTLAALEAIATSGNANFLLAVLDRATRQFVGEPTPPVILSTDLVVLTRQAMTTQLFESDPLTLSIETRSAVWQWSRVDPVGFGLWIKSLRERVGDLPTLAFFVNASVALGTRTPVTRLTGLDRQNASEHFDLGKLRDQYATDIANVGEIEVDDFDGPPDTPQDRLRVALAGLRSEP